MIFLVLFLSARVFFHSWHEKEKPVQKRNGEKHPTARRNRQRGGTPRGDRRHFLFFFISLPFSPHGLYLPAESREENLTELVFVPQLLGGLDEARAGLRAVSYLRTQWKRAPLLQSRQLQLGF